MCGEIEFVLENLKCISWREPYFGVVGLNGKRYKKADNIQVQTFCKINSSVLYFTVIGQKFANVCDYKHKQAKLNIKCQGLFAKCVHFYDVLIR